MEAIETNLWESQVCKNINPPTKTQKQKQNLVVKPTAAQKAHDNPVKIMHSPGAHNADNWVEKWKIGWKEGVSWLTVTWKGVIHKSTIYFRFH